MTTATVTLDRHGCLVVPAAVCRSLGWRDGDTFTVRTEGHGVVLELLADPVVELRGLTAPVPAVRSLVDELLLERRAEAGSD